MDIRQLSYFIEVAHQGSFTKAAQKINISQPALSKCIQNFEEELGVSLFIREHGKLTLTKTGITILDGAESLINHFNSLQEEFNNMHHPGKDIFSIGCTSLLGSIFGAKLIDSFINECNAYNVTYSEYSTERLIRRVFHSELDIAICLICSQDYNYLDKVFIDPFYDGRFLAAIRSQESANCKCLTQLTTTQNRLSTSSEFSGFSSGKLYQNYLSVFYTDHIVDIVNHVSTKGTIGLIPDIAKPYFSDTINFLSINTPITYQIAFVTRKNMHCSKKISKFKKYITTNFQHLA